MAEASELMNLLDTFRSSARTEREKGSYFEALAKVYFENDDVQQLSLNQVWTYADWAELHGFDKNDDGIDLVASLRDESGFCAIQCKFYDAQHTIQKSDLDSFFTASGKAHFIQRILVDTTTKPLGKNANNALDGQAIPVRRIGLKDLEDSRINWSAFVGSGKVLQREKKRLRLHQSDALQAVQSGLETADRGKLIMACGTGKTFTSLKIAETLAGKGKRVLFLVPSLSLMSQTVTEWSSDTEIELRAFAVCSDAKVGKRRSNDDMVEVEVHDLAFPATTNAEKLAEQANATDAQRMTVVFSTYQSIQAIHRAQSEFDLPAFDLIICDEAHRTTGATLENEEESAFVRVHDNDYIAGHKRLYMTATPKIFGENAKSKADEHAAELCSMDDESLFGKELFHRGFAWAVENQLLTDYKVIVLAVDEGVVSRSVQRRLADGDSELNLDEASKIVGCYRAMMKDSEDFALFADTQPMKTALAFCKSIKVSKMVSEEFAEVVQEYREVHGESEQALACQVQHIDGSFDAKRRETSLSWLQSANDEECRVLSNVRCLSEGVDVPALDAIMFMHPRKSLIDVVQSVGRVMRRAEGKRLGYVILPIGVPPGVPAEKALADNQRYQVVWQVLNALRAHDERLDADINRAGLGDGLGDRIQVVGFTGSERAATTAVVDELPDRRFREGANLGSGNGETSGDGSERPGRGTNPNPNPNPNLILDLDEFTDAIIAKIVRKCGTRDYWEDWAVDIAKIAERHITRITAIVETQPDAAKAFEQFLIELRDDLNDSVTRNDAVEMLAQHVITKPVFNALFSDSRFTEKNPVSQAIQRVLDTLEAHNLEKESESLTKFYASVKRRAEGIESAAAKQKLVVELYDKFFRKAFPLMTEKLGIVYTPVEVVDFILHSVNAILISEFGQRIGSPGVHILDPFTGTGTFITRLLESGLISRDELAHKYRHELHANEIVLLAYYIAAINIEATYNSVMQSEYEEFPGITLCDSFDLFERGDSARELFPENSDRRVRLKELQDIRVIIGNPPYSSGQDSANDNAANVKYEQLDRSIAETYAARSTATNKNALYDSYIRAIRWSTDRLGDSGIIAFVTNAGWIDGNAMDGLRKTLADEFSTLFIFHLRGNQRTSGELSRQEGGKIFGGGSRAPIAISLLIKNPAQQQRGQIFFHDIGDYLSREEKLAKIAAFGNIDGITDAMAWQRVQPDKHGDWLNQRDESFGAFLPIGDKKDKSGKVLFATYSRGVATARDAWCYNASETALSDNMTRMIDFYNSERQRYALSGNGAKSDDFVDSNAKKISWNRSLKADLGKEKVHGFSSEALRLSIYRPFTRQHMYFSREFNDMVYQMPSLFPQPETENRVISVCGLGGKKDFHALMLGAVVDLNAMEGGAQCFPLKSFSYIEPKDDLFADTEGQWQEHDAITDFGLQHFLDAYPGETLSKEDLFYYVYGLLHSPDYRQRYGASLKKQLPRIPAVAKAEGFWAFSRAGRELGDLHVGFDEVAEYDSTTIEVRGGADIDTLSPEDYRVVKMKFSGKRGAEDKSTILYNGKITLTGIPLQAYDYIVNGKSAIEWVMERQCVKTDKDSGIVNDANCYAMETVGDAAYPLKLLRRVVTVSMETVRIVASLPALTLKESE